jgi:hypothetical protein
MYRALVLLVLLSSRPAPAQPAFVSGAGITNASLVLQWQGGQGPFQPQVSQDLVVWSDLLDPIKTNRTTVPAAAREQFHRLVDLDPEARQGEFFGLVQTEQGEFGDLFGRHRLKSRLWLYTTRQAPHTNATTSPAAFWRQLVIHFQTHAEGRVTTWSGPLETLGRVDTPTDRRMILAWTNGVSTNARTFQFTLEFPYALAASRPGPLLASDPMYSLQCQYETPQPELDGGSLVLTTTRVDRVNLVQMDPANPVETWSNRKYRVTKRGVQVELHFLEGAPLYQGSPPWILKTLLLDRWLAPAIASGGSLPSLVTDSYFSRTLLPGHHNFFEIVLIEPGLDPALPRETREALERANIRYIYTFKDLAGVTVGGDAEDIRFIGFDGGIRSP